MKYKIQTFDFEIKKDWWCVTFLDEEGNYRTFVKEQQLDLIDYIIKNKNTTIFVGYNSFHFDDWCLKCIWYDINPYKVVYHLIDLGEPMYDEHGNCCIKELQYKKNIPFMSFDLMRVIGVMAPSLKDIEANMGIEIYMDKSIAEEKWQNLTNEEKQELIRYNRHDVYATMCLYKKLASELDAYTILMEHFNLPPTLLRKKKAQIFEEMCKGKFRKTPTPYEYQYQAPKFLHFTDDTVKDAMEKFIFTDDNTFEYNLMWDGYSYDFGRGGAHYAIKNYQKTFDGNTILVMNDFASFYPSMMCNKTNPELRYVNPIIDWTEFCGIVDMRLEAKKSNPALASALKIPVNAAYGKTIDEHFKYSYWPAGLNICLTGQLITLMICQELKRLGIGKLIQVNTDGFYYELKKEELDKFNEIMDNFQKEIGIDFERDVITNGKIIQKDVNNYIIYDADTKHTKVKGALVKKYQTKQDYMYYAKSIVDDAIVNNLLFDTPINKTIMDAFNNNDSRKFQLIYNMKGKNFTQCYYGKEKIQKINRGFPSSDKSLPDIRKLKNGTYYKFPDMPEHVYLYNGDLKNFDIRKIGLDIQYYIDLANKGIKQFLGGI